MAKNYTTAEINIKGHPLEVRVYKEFRDSYRYSIGKKYIILRMPYGTDVGPLMEIQLGKLRQWVDERIRETPGILNRLVPRIYRHEEELRVMGDVYTLNITESIRKTVTAKISGSTIFIKCPSNAKEKSKQDGIREVIIKLMNKAYLPVIKHRVFQINDRFFREPIENVTLKYNTSNWGSCSSIRNINLSSRLLLTNRDVIDYVIVHELAHLKEMNHSKAFWDIVERVMPDYQKYEDWLDDNGTECYF